jgi:tetratricopeptide (TPR) repeat protein
MKKFWILLIAMGLCTGAMAQENAVDSSKQTRPLSPAEILMIHAAKKYQLSMRYNDLDGAKEALYSILVENPRNDSLLYSLSYIFLERGQYASSAIAAQDLITLNPDHTGGLEILGIAYENLGLQDKSLQAYEDLYFKTNDYQTLYKVAFLQFQMGKHTESLQNADILLSKPEADQMKAVFQSTGGDQKEFTVRVALLNLKGMNAKALALNDDARQYFEEALAIAPDFKLSSDALAELK